jgi:hypothetical protein
MWVRLALKGESLRFVDNGKGRRGGRGEEGKIQNLLFFLFPSSF